MNDKPDDQDRLHKAIPPIPAARSDGELVPELKAYQSELEMQNHELRRSQVLMEKMRDRYVDLYDFAPVGYLTLTRNGMIAEVNFTAASLLGTTRDKLLKHRFDAFVSPDEGDRWVRYFLAALRRDDSTSCELILRHSDGSSLDVRLTSLMSGDVLSPHESDASRPDQFDDAPLLRIAITDISELKTAQRMLWEKNNLLDSIVENIPNMIFLKRASDLTFELFNRAGEQLLGYPRSALLGKGNYDFWPREQGDWFTAEDRKALDSVNNTEIPEEAISTASGETRYLHTWKVALRDAQGVPSHLLGISVDITGRKKAERIHERLMAHLDASPDFVGFADAVNFHITFLNRAGRIMVGIAADEDLSTQKTTDFCPAWVNQLISEIAIPEAIRSGFWEGEGAFLHRDGHEVPVSMVVVAHKSQTGTLEAISTISRDISQRRQAEQLIERSREQLETFIRQAPISIAMFDLNMNYLSVSDRWRVESGRGPEDLTGLNHYEIHPDLPVKWKLEHQQAMSGATLQSSEDMWILGDGRKYWLRRATLPWLDGHGKIGGIIIMVEDITSQKTLEHEAHERRHEMEELQKKRVAMQTAAAIAHEINQPLLAIASYSEAALLLMQAGNPNLDKVRKAVTGCEHQALRAGQSIREMLELLGNTEFMTEDFDLNREISNVIEDAKSEHDLPFNTVLRLEDGLPLVRANRTHVQKVLINLLHNGIEAMHEAGVPLPTLTLTLRTMSGKKAAQLTIQDNGPGVKVEDLHRLFEPFFTTRARGLGMGLVISRALIEENGGQLWIDPEEGIGATFHLTLPFAT